VTLELLHGEMETRR